MSALCEEMRDGYQRKMKEISIARETSRYYSNEHHFGSHIPTQVRQFENHASWAGYLDGQVNCPTFYRNVHRDVIAVQLSTHVLRTRQCVSNTSSIQCGIG
jgi:hypothetical protein